MIRAELDTIRVLQSMKTCSGKEKVDAHLHTATKNPLHHRSLLFTRHTHLLQVFDPTQAFRKTDLYTSREKLHIPQTITSHPSQSWHPGQVFEQYTEPEYLF
eukprot:TRINITY_DN1205_c0_g2_i1.p1 TRINITY_DN1205_c0_g2~~TRINITY_DN1205_c0_g2_i1.p1  ORF type:complete len:102 (+),score=9.85 TRINITY_DN1205_c0_g2_i1:160-465(+)